MEVDESQDATAGASSASRPQPAPVQRKGSFKQCTARFDGSRDDLNKFLVTICLFKDMEKVNEDVALNELPLLFEGEAAEWWEDVGGDVAKWSDAMAMLQDSFAPKRAAYEIYSELFSSKQDANAPTDEFIKQKRALLAELPNPHPEEVQIDMIYWMLKKPIRRKISRNAIINFEDMIEKARYVDNMEKRKASGSRQWDEETMAKYFARSLVKCPHHKHKKEKYLHERNEERCHKCNKRKHIHGKYKNTTINIERFALCTLDSNTLERFASCSLVDSKDNTSSSSSCHHPSPS